MFGFLPQSHAAAGWQINAHGLELEQEYGLRYASDTRGGPPFLPVLAQGISTCPQLPTTLPTFDEILGRDGVDESTIAQYVFQLSAVAAEVPDNLQAFTLHAELEEFVDAARSRKEPRTNGAAGRAALELAGRVVASIQEHAARVNLLGGRQSAGVLGARKTAVLDVFATHDKTK